MIDLDKKIISILKDRTNFTRYIGVVTRSGAGLSDTTKEVVKDFARYYRSSEDITHIDTTSFYAWATAAGLDRYSKEIGWSVARELVETQTSTEADSSIIKELAKRATAKEIEKLTQSDRAGELDSAWSMEVQKRLDALSEITQDKELESVQVSIEDLIEEERSKDGIRWRLSCLNDTMRPLRSGDFGIIAALVDVGKTSFLASELTFMARQLSEGRPILWINNEGPGRRIVSRCWQAGLGLTFKGLIELEKEKILHSSYAEAVGGEQAIKVYDAHDRDSADIERIIKTEKPSLIVWDMLDNVRFAGEMRNGGQRSDQILESLYQWARGLGVRYDCINLATSQLSAAAEGKKFPSQHDLKDSRIGKCGAADFVLTISRDPDLDSIRCIGLPKNKLSIAGHKRNPFASVYFNHETSRYSDSDGLDGVKPYETIEEVE